MQATVDRKQSILDRPILSYITLNWEWLLIAALFLIAAATRYYDLGTRALHHDESIHARWSWDLYQSGNSFRHDPTYHGPFLYYAVNLAFILFGATDYTSRVAPAFFGMILVLLPLLLRKHLGRAGAIATMFFIVLSPSILYYSRSLRHDIFALAGTMAMVIAIFRYLDERNHKWTWLFALAFTVSYTSHELTFITGYILLGAFAIAIIYEYSRMWPLAFVGLLVYASGPAVNLPLAMIVLAIPVGLWTVVWLLKGLGLLSNARLDAGPVTGAIAALTGRDFLAMAAIWAAIAVPLFTTMFNWLTGLSTGTIGAITYWLSQHSVARGGQPGYYYLIMLPLYEFMPLLFAIIGFVYWCVTRFAAWRVRPDREEARNKVISEYFPFFLGYWFLSSLILYSWAGEKMPWLVIHITLPLCVLAGWFINKLVLALDLENIRENGGGLLAIALPLFVILLGAVLNRRPALGGTALDQQAQTIQWLAMALLLIGLAGFIGWLWSRLGTRSAAHVAALVLLAVLSLFTVRAAWMASFTHGDIAKDMLVYVQSSRDVTNVVKRVEALSMRMTSGKDLVISYDDESSWPLTWYFRDFKNQKFEPKGPTAPPDTPVVIVGLVNDDKVKPLMGKYERTHLKLRWWFPEFYKSADETARTFLDQAGKQKLPPRVTWPDAFRALMSPVGRQRLWRFWLYRDLWDPNTGREVTYGQLGSTDFVVYVRKDLADSFWSGGPAVTKAAAPSAETAAYERATRVVAAAATFGGQRGAGQGQFVEPKNVAVDAQGNIYVADTLNHRIQKLDSTGKVLMVFGSEGEGDGQFKEPWSLVVDQDGNIFVADTWNHRIQKFDKDGKFVTKWGDGLVDTRGVAGGQPSVFYGPRQITLDKDGNLLVADTGNKRIQKFDRDGKFLAQFGVVGTLEGQFNEPTGVAVDKDGNIYVADAWNHRIQKFGPDFKYITQWPVVGWESESIVNKPFLAVDPDGNVYATDPEGHRVLKFTNTGSILAIWGKFGNDSASFNLPVGIAIDSAGNSYVADALNNRIQKFAPVR